MCAARNALVAVVLVKGGEENCPAGSSQVVGPHDRVTGLLSMGKLPEIYRQVVVLADVEACFSSTAGEWMMYRTSCR
jgi:hypothetical protein